MYACYLIKKLETQDIINNSISRVHKFTYKAPALQNINNL